jgi:hypothetical protein
VSAAGADFDTPGLLVRRFIHRYTPAGIFQRNEEDEEPQLAAWTRYEVLYTPCGRFFDASRRVGGEACNVPITGIGFID